MSLHLVRLPVDPRALAAFAVANRASDDDGGYALHLALRCRFGTAAPQPFRFFLDHRAGPHLLGYIGDADALVDAAGLPSTDPLLASVFDAPVTQPMPAQWRTGARYRFEVRVRPVVRYGKRIRTLRRERARAWQNKAGEIDAFVAACEKAGPVAEGNLPVDREAVYLAWLRDRMTATTDVDGAEMRLLQRVKTRRRVHAKPQSADPSACGTPPRDRLRYQATEGPDALMAGTLTVTDPAAFAQLLARGVGRHAAFGYGMLLLSPPGRAG